MAKHDAILMAQENAQKNLDERVRKGKLEQATGEEAAEQLQKAIGLTEPLERMDCFDISHTPRQGNSGFHGGISPKSYLAKKIIVAIRYGRPRANRMILNPCRR